MDLTDQTDQTDPKIFLSSLTGFDLTYTSVSYSYSYSEDILCKQAFLLMPRNVWQSSSSGLCLEQAPTIPIQLSAQELHYDQA